MDDERDRATPAWVDVDKLKEEEEIGILASVNRPSNDKEEWYTILGLFPHGMRSLLASLE